MKMTWNPPFAFGCVPVQRLRGRAGLGGGGGARARGGAADQVAPAAAPAAAASVLVGRLAVILVELRLPGILWRVEIRTYTNLWLKFKHIQYMKPLVHRILGYIL